MNLLAFTLTSNPGLRRGHRLIPQSRFRRPRFSSGRSALPCRVSEIKKYFFVLFSVNAMVGNEAGQAGPPLAHAGIGTRPWGVTSKRTPRGFGLSTRPRRTNNVSVFVSPQTSRTATRSGNVFGGGGFCFRGARRSAVGERAGPKERIIRFAMARVIALRFFYYPVSEFSSKILHHGHLSRHPTSRKNFTRVKSF